MCDAVNSPRSLPYLRSLGSLPTGGTKRAIAILEAPHVLGHTGGVKNPTGIQEFYDLH